MPEERNNNQLAAGWRRVPLADVIGEAKPGFASGARDAKGVVQLRMNNVNTWGKMVWSEFIRVPAEGSVVNEYQLRPGDVLFNNTNSVELVGKSALFLGFRERVVYSNHFTRLRALAEQLDPQYFAAWLLQQWQLKVFESICNRWIGQSAVKNDKLLALEIPLPPVGEQKRIAAILNEQMAAVERARAAAEAQLEASKALPAAYLRAVFSSREAQQWPRKPFGDLVENFDGRRVPVKLDDRRSRKGPYPYYGASGIIDRVDGYLFDGEFLLIGEDGANLLLRSSPIAFRANGKFWVNNHAHVVQPKGAIPLDYLLHFLATIDLTPYVTGAAQPKLTQDDMNSIPVPMPPHPDQMRIVVILNEQMASADRARKAVEEELDAINKLPAALLRRAFNGEL